MTWGFESPCILGILYRTTRWTYPTELPSHSEKHVLESGGPRLTKGAAPRRARARLADVLRPVRAEEDAVAVGDAAAPLPDIDVAVGVPQAAPPRRRALEPLAVVLRAVGPGAGAEAGGALGIRDAGAGDRLESRRVGGMPDPAESA